MQRENNNNNDKEKMPRLGLKVDRGRKGRKKKDLGLEVIKGKKKKELGLKKKRGRKSVVFGVLAFLVYFCN